MTEHLVPKVAPPGRPLVGVGLFVLDDEDRFILLRRRGSHGAGTWGLVGGHLEHGQSPEEAAVAEAREEMGLDLDPASLRRIPHYTSDVFADEGKHYVTLYLHVRLPEGQVPAILEPHKIDLWSWSSWHVMPEPLFLPLVNLRLAVGATTPWG